MESILRSNLSLADRYPPTFIFFVNNKNLVHFTYERHLENAIRERYKFLGTPLVLRFKTNEGKPKIIKKSKRESEVRTWKKPPPPAPLRDGKGGLLPRATSVKKEDGLTPEGTPGSKAKVTKGKIIQLRRKEGQVETKRKLVANQEKDKEE